MAQGIWTLKVADESLGDAGRLLSWCLEITAAQGTDVAVLLSGLEAEPRTEGVQLRWRLDGSAEVAGLRVLRSVDDAPPLLLTRSPLEPVDGPMAYLDPAADLRAGSRLRYLLQGEDVDGRAFDLGEISLRYEAPRRAAFALEQNHPNPFNPSTTIVYRLESGGPVRLRIFDAAGRLVRTLVEGDQAAGEHRVQWQGLDQAGRGVAAGAYYYRLESGGRSLVRRMVLLK
mgnify:CR=1 FL=1